MFGLFKKQQQKPEAADKQESFDVDSSDNEMSANEVLQAINQMQKELDKLKLAMARGAGFLPREETGERQAVDLSFGELKDRESTVKRSETEKVIEGVFDGQHMIGADGGQYDVPANYASKSKLVEGDILKLTINNLGAFVYKQIKPIERIRLVGILDQDEQSLQYYALADGKKWKLLTASVTYFKGESGDEVVFFIPSSGVSKWAAVENIVK